MDCVGFELNPWHVGIDEMEVLFPKKCVALSPRNPTKTVPRKHL
jgi:hypothetical protein